MKKHKKAISFVICIMFIFMLFSNVLVSSNIEHLENCYEEHCEICALIHIAENNLNNIVSLIIMSFFLLFISIYKNKIKTIIRKFISITLVNCKVQFNN